MSRKVKLRENETETEFWKKLRRLVTEAGDDPDAVVAAILRETQPFRFEAEDVTDFVVRVEITGCTVEGETRYMPELLFDAEPWLVVASEADIREIAGENWLEGVFHSNTYDEDEPAGKIVNKYPEGVRDYEAVRHIRDRFEDHDQCEGFEFHWDCDAAEAWVRTNRPQLYAQMLSEGLFTTVL